MSDTPKTDAEAMDGWSGDAVCVPVEFARGQERTIVKLVEALTDVEMIIDEQIYDEQVKEDFDAPDDREYSINLTAKQVRAISAALAKVKP